MEMTIYKGATFNFTAEFFDTSDRPINIEGDTFEFFVKESFGGKTLIEKNEVSHNIVGNELKVEISEDITGKIEYGILNGIGFLDWIRGGKRFRVFVTRINFIEKP